jgi:hypothetical protein
MSGQAVQAGQLTASVFASGTALRVLHVSACPDSGPACAAGEVPPYLHDQDVEVAEVRPVLEYGLTQHLSVEAQLPVRAVRSRITYRQLDGTPFTPPNADLHHRNETLAGPGDAWLSGRAAWQLGAVWVSGRLGATLPLGRTEENPFALGEAGIEHQHVQFGTGTVNVLAGADAAWRPGPLSVRGYGQVLWVPAPNGRGYQAGNRLAAGALAEWTLKPLQLSAGLDVVSEAPERWDGGVQQDGNVGRTDLLVGGGVAVLTDAGRWGLTARVPVYQHYLRTEDDGGQLTYPVVLQLSWSRGFELGRGAR